MKKLHIFIFFTFLISLFFCACKENNQLKKTEINYQNQTLTDDFDYLPTSTTNQIIKHDFYTLSYQEKYEQAEWVAYELKPTNFSNTSYKRPYFIEDKKVTTGSADWRNYKNSGYNKGHLCPAGDMKFSKEAYDDTFFTSNISPQKYDFNSGVWNRLEQKVRFWADKYDGIYVITGGVLEQNLKTIGREKVAIPNYFYKVLLDTSRDEIKMIAFLVPHQKSEKPLYEFVISVDELEEKTGIDFFPSLPDSIENELEKAKSYKAWSF